MPELVLEKWTASLSQEEAAKLAWDWRFWARPEQMPPDSDWFCWLLLAGRGYGKSRSGAEWVVGRARDGFRRIALVGQTKADVRDTMIEVGDSAILNVSPPWFRPEYQPSKRRLVWPNGAMAIAYSGDEPDQLRGPQHDSAWVDELAKFKYPKATWDNLEFGLRIGEKPQVVVTTTPRPISIIRKLIADQKTVVTRGSTYDNIPNLARAFVQRILAKYEGTRLGRQELHGEVLEDNPAALWTRADIDKHRVTQFPELEMIYVSVDPSTTSGGDEAGIVAAGCADVEETKHLYVLEDVSLQGSPKAWAEATVALYYKLKANLVVAESNQGGEMVALTIRTVDKNVPVELVHASRGKRARAEPVSSIYQQGRGHHVGTFAMLEDELCQWDGSGESPNRLDALVQAATGLIIDRQGGGGTLGVARIRTRQGGREWR